MLTPGFLVISMSSLFYKYYCYCYSVCKVADSMKQQNQISYKEAEEYILRGLPTYEDMSLEIHPMVK